MRKIVALFCSALLLFSVPIAAFGDDTAQTAAVKFEDSVGDSHNDRTQELNSSFKTATFDSGIITEFKAKIGPDSASAKPTWDLSFYIEAPAPVPEQISTFLNPYKHKIVKTAAAELQFIDKEDSTETVIVGPLSSSGGTMTFNYRVNPSLLPAGTSAEKAAEGLHYYLYAVPADTKEVKTLASNAPADQATNNISLPARTTTLITVLVDPNIPDPVDPKPSKPKPNNASKFDSGSDSDSSASGWRDIQVVGSSDVTVQGNLNGANISDGDNAYVSVKRLTSGSAFDELRATAGGDNLDKAFDVALYVNGKEVHSDFGRLRISFAVGTQYNGRKAIVWHRHNDGQLTSQDTWVIDGDVTVEVTDLSEFGIDIEGVSTAATQVDDSTTSPKTGQSIPAGTAPLALAVAGALGTMAFIASHRRAR